MRVRILKDYVKQHFPATPLLDYALEVEKITTSKVKNAPTPKSQFWVNFLEKNETANLLVDCVAKLNLVF